MEKVPAEGSEFSLTPAFKPVNQARAGESRLNSLPISFLQQPRACRSRGQDHVLSLRIARVQPLKGEPRDFA
jgi:hypothetical protein